MTEEEVKPSNINQLTDEELYTLYKKKDCSADSTMALIEMARRVEMKRDLIDTFSRPKAVRRTAEATVVSAFRTLRLGEVKRG